MQGPWPVPVRRNDCLGLFPVLANCSHDDHNINDYRSSCRLSVQESPESIATAGKEETGAEQREPEEEDKTAKFETLFREQPVNDLVSVTADVHPKHVPQAGLAVGTEARMRGAKDSL